MKRLLVLAAAVLMVIGAAAPAAATPSDGNSGKMFVVEIADIVDGIPCPSGDELDLEVNGWIKGRSGNEQRNLEVTVFHINETWTNANGDAWTWRDRGPDHVKLQKNADGELVAYLTVTGRSGLNNIGHMVINLDTGEIELLAGQRPFGGEPFERSPYDYACDTLT